MVAQFEIGGKAQVIGPYRPLVNQTAGATATRFARNGTWKIVAGTERYATLRGQGTYTGHLVSGNRDDPDGPRNVTCAPWSYAATSNAQRVRVESF
jgi:hypothetical protein